MTVSGIDLSQIDPQVRPQDDLFAHFNGAWLNTYEIPADRGSHGSFHELRDSAEKQVFDIVETCDAADPHGAKVRALYDSYMDTTTIDALGLSPLEPLLQRINGITEQASLFSVMGTMCREGLPGLFSLSIFNDLKDATRTTAYVNQSGLGLPDESYYREEQYAEVREAYISLLTDLAKAAGLENPAQVATDVFALETAIAAVHWNVVDNRDAEKSYNHFTLEAALAEFPAAHLDIWLQSLTAGNNPLTELIISQPSFLQSASELVSTYDLAIVKQWLSLRLISSLAPYLTQELSQRNFEFYGTVLTGATEQRDRWKRAVGLVEGAVGEILGQLYVDKHFPPAAKQRMDELVANHIEAYKNSIEALDWMTQATKKRALEKLAKFTPKIGYPKAWRNYDALTVDAADLVGNVLRSNILDSEFSLAKIGAPVDRNEWHMTPQTVNAYYNPTMNEIVFPAAILQPPFFNAEADDAVNYGGIGAVIAHEIGHGFDDQGSKFDGDGNMVSWWTQEDREAFEDRTKALIAQYDAYSPRNLGPEHTVNGAFTIGENIGDLGGLSIALKAYELSLDGKEAPVIDGYTGIQRVFLSWAQIWRGKARPESAIQLLAIDPHSPAEFRCNGIVTNVDAFYEAFDVQPGDGHYTAPKDRVRIW